jgi:hypothetical protein
MFNAKYFLASLAVYIPYAILWFFWHNNLFPDIYYFNQLLYSVSEQNIWLMNLANAFLSYGMVFFYFQIDKKISLFLSIVYCLFYNLSVLVFFNLMLIGAFKINNYNFIFLEFLWAVLIGIISGILLFYIYNKLNFYSRNLK